MLTLHRQGDIRRDVRSNTYHRLAMDYAVILWDALGPWLSTDAADDIGGQVAVVRALGYPDGADLAARLLLEYGGHLDVPAIVEAMRDRRAAWITLDGDTVARRAVEVEGVAAC